RQRRAAAGVKHRSPDGALRHPGPPVPHFASLNAGYDGAIDLAVPAVFSRGDIRHERTPMTALSERLNTPISTAELQRRWQAVRGAMQRDRIDVLLMQNNNDHMGGYVRWFTDMPAVNGYPNTVVFPRDADMTVVTQGPFGGAQELPAEGDGMWRGVR